MKCNEHHAAGNKLINTVEQNEERQLLKLLLEQTDSTLKSEQVNLDDSLLPQAANKVWQMLFIKPSVVSVWPQSRSPTSLI